MRPVYLFGGAIAIGALVNEVMGTGHLLVSALLVVLWWMLIDAIASSGASHGQAADLGTDTSRNGVDGIERGHPKTDRIPEPPQ